MSLKESVLSDASYGRMSVTAEVVLKNIAHKQ